MLSIHALSLGNEDYRMVPIDLFVALLELSSFHGIKAGVKLYYPDQNQQQIFSLLHFTCLEVLRKRVDNLPGADVIVCENAFTQIFPYENSLSNSSMFLTVMLCCL